MNEQLYLNENQVMEILSINKDQLSSLGIKGKLMPMIITGDGLRHYSKPEVYLFSKQIHFIKLDQDAKIPQYKTEGSAGADICSLDDVTIHPGEAVLVSTGIAIELPQGLECQVRLRSGHALKGLIIPNAPGTIDNDYRGEIKIIVHNLSKVDVIISKGERVAQLVIAPYSQFKFTEVGYLSETERGIKGFGSTGKKEVYSDELGNIYEEQPFPGGDIAKELFQAPFREFCTLLDKLDNGLTVTETELKEKLYVLADTLVAQIMPKGKFQ